MDEKLVAFGRLLKIMDELRAQCAWDQKQTFEMEFSKFKEIHDFEDMTMDKE